MSSKHVYAQEIFGIPGQQTVDLFSLYGKTPLISFRFCRTLFKLKIKNLNMIIASVDKYLDLMGY